MIKDFHYNSLYNKIGPLAIRNEESYQSRILIELRSSEVPVREVIDKITHTVDEIDNTTVPDVNFLDQHIAKLFAYYAIKTWLENYEYKASISWWIFALSGILVLGIAMLTVSWQSWRAATSNPVVALRHE